MAAGVGRAAVPAPDGSIDSGVAWHYGDPLGEQRVLASGQAVVDLSHRAVLEVSGPDRLPWLHSLTTQHLLDLLPGDSALALVLDPRGRVEHEIHLIESRDAVFLVIEGGLVESLLSYLDSMRFWSAVEVSDATARWAVVGGGADERRGDAPRWVTPEGFRERLPRAEFLVPRGDLPRVLAESPAVAGTWAWEALRIAAGIPRHPLDTDNRTIPHEVGWIGPAVHLHKGCYRGQETVARVQNLGRPPRRLVLLHADGELPHSGSAVRLEGRTVGTVGSVGQHWELGPIALAIVKRQVPADAVLSVAPAPNDPGRDIAASQEIIVGAG